MTRRYGRSRQEPPCTEILSNRNCAGFSRKRQNPGRRSGWRWRMRFVPWLRGNARAIPPRSYARTVSDDLGSHLRDRVRAKGHRHILYAVPLSGCGTRIPAAVRCCGICYFGQMWPARIGGAGFFGCFGFFCSLFCLSRLPIACLLSWRWASMLYQ